MGTIYKDGINYSGGGNTNSVALTQAEYDALSEAEKNSDTVYFITDAGGSDNVFYFREILNSGAQTYDMTFAELKAAWDAKKVGVFIGGAGNAFPFNEFMYYSSADANGERLVFNAGDGSKIERIFTVRPDDSVTFATNDTGWIMLDNDYITGLAYRKRNSVVFIEFNNNGAIKQSLPIGPTFTVLGTLPEGFRPTIPKSIQIAASYGEAFGVTQVLPTGVIQVRMFAAVEYSATSPHYITGSTSYPVD